MSWLQLERRNTMPIRTYKTIARTTLAATATGFAALTIAAPASASGGVLDTPIGVGGCVAAPPNACGKPISLPFTTTAGDAVQVVFTPNPNSDCPNFTVAGNFDGVTAITFAPQPLALGNHTVNIDATCATGQFTSWGGHLVVDQIKQTGKPKPATGPAAPTATVTSDVDLYDVPGGNGNIIGQLRKGQVVTLDTTQNSTCPSKDWCVFSNPKGAAWGFVSNN
jgi:hypothetical protein